MSFEIERFVFNLFGVYIALIIASIVISWIPRMPYNPALRAVLDFVDDVTRPYLSFFRRFIPMVRLGPAGIDLSPMIGIFALVILQSVVLAVIP